MLKGCERWLRGGWIMPTLDAGAMPGHVPERACARMRASAFAHHSDAFLRSSTRARILRGSCEILKALMVGKNIRVLQDGRGSQV